jgi:hypothetical protein
MEMPQPKMLSVPVVLVGVSCIYFSFEFTVFSKQFDEIRYELFLVSL